MSGHVYDEPWDGDPRGALIYLDPEPISQWFRDNEIPKGRDFRNMVYSCFNQAYTATNNFIDLIDTPSEYIADKYLKVNAAGDAIEFIDAIDISLYLPLAGGTMSGNIDMDDNNIIFYNNPSAYIGADANDDIVISNDNGGVVFKNTPVSTHFDNSIITSYTTGGLFPVNIKRDLITSARDIELPDASGTIALTLDLDNYLPLAGGTMSGAIDMDGNVVLFDTYSSAYAEDDKTIALKNTYSAGSLVRIIDGGLNVYDRSTISGKRITLDAVSDKIVNYQGKSGTLNFPTLSDDRTWDLPDASGEIALIIPTPSTSTSTGSVGQISYDASYMYICTATNTWKRTSLSTW